MDFNTAVKDLIALLNEGEPLAAFDRFFSDDGVVFDNDEKVAIGKADARTRLEETLAGAQIIIGDVPSCAVDIEDEICVFRSQTTLIDAEGKETHLDRLYWIQWSDGKIAAERCYRDELMAEKIEDGILETAVPTASEELMALDPRASAEAAAMRAPMLGALQYLIDQEHVEIEPKLLDAVADELILAGLEAHNPRHALKKLRLALIHSDNVEEIYASDLELESAFRRAMGG